MKTNRSYSGIWKEPVPSKGWKKFPAFYFLTFLVLFLVIHLFQFNGLYGQDSYEYVRYASECRNFMLHGIQPGPLRLSLLFPAIGGLLALIAPVQEALQFITLASLVVSAYLFEKIIQVQFKTGMRQARVYSFLFLLLSPFLLRIAFTDMSDMPALCLLLAAWYAFVRLEENYSVFFLSLFTAASCSAVMTRYGAFLLLLPPGFRIIQKYIRRISLRDILLTVAPLFLFSLPYLLLHNNPFRLGLEHPWATEWSPLNFLRSSFTNSNGNYHYTVQNIIYAFLSFFHPGFLFCGVLLVFYYRSINLTNTLNRILIISLVLYAFLLAGIPFQNLRFPILAFPFFLLLVFPVYMQVSSMIKFNPIWLTTGIVLIQLGLFTKAFIPFYNSNKQERLIAMDCQAYPIHRLFTFSISGALAFYNPEYTITDLWEHKLDSVPPNSYLLFNKDAFEKEYAGKNPMINYDFITKNYKLTTLKQWPDGWTLYEIR